MITTAPIQPNPGSNDALEMGCICPVVDNAHGRLESPLGWWITHACPLHDRPWTRSGL